MLTEATTETDIVTTTETAQPLAVSAAKRDKRTSEINTEHGTLTLDGNTYHTATLSEAAIKHLALVGLRHTLVTSDDPAARFKQIEGGVFSVRVPAKPKELPPMRKAIAHAVAEAKVKEAGHKAKSPEAALILENCLQQVVSLTKEEVKARSTHLAVMTHYARIMGDASAPAAALLG